MIDSIKVKNIATFNEIGVQILNLKKINFIYGVNGSGKTTISNFINDPIKNDFKDCTLNWKYYKPLKSLVYNKEFKERNFGNENIDGVFTLGQSTKVDIENIEKMSKDLEDLSERMNKKSEEVTNINQKLSDYDDEFKEKLWTDIYKKYEKDFKSAFMGFMIKESFKNKIINEYNSNQSELKTYDQLIEKAFTVFNKMPIIIQSISTFDFTKITKIQNNEIWKKKIIGKSDVEISKLIKSLNINDWVNEGRSYIQLDDICPFCQQETISENFRVQLENYFDESFSKDVSLIKSLTAEYDQITKDLEIKLNDIEEIEKAKSNSKLEIENFSNTIRTLISQFVANKELQKNKIKEPSRIFELIPINEQIDNLEKIISKANKEIQTHNDLINNLTDERVKLINEIWKFLIEEYKSNLNTYFKSSRGLLTGFTSLKNQLEALKSEYSTLNLKIKEANKNITSVQPSVDEINKILNSFGFSNFQIVPSNKNKKLYQIHRNDGTIAESTLSEGEISFITFLYFLQLSKGSTEPESISEERILVIDDPISSLDSNILFVVCSLLKEVIKSIKNNESRIKQIILLTHNVYFHKEVSFIDGKSKENKDTNYWILRRKNSISEIEAFEKKNPIQNSYELLWLELKNKDKNSGITIQNIMRRIIENYFKLLGKYGDEKLIQKFTNIQEQEICRSLICWINEGSHSFPDDLYVELQDTVIDKYFEVFKEIFNVTGHIEHYNMMMGENSN